MTNEAASKLFERFWEWRLKASPEFATIIGNHKYDDQLDSYSLQAFEERVGTSPTVSSGFRQEWYRWKALAMRIKKGIGTTRPNPTVHEIWAHFFRDVMHKENTCRFFVADAVQITSEDNMDENTRLNLELFITQLNSFIVGMGMKGYLFPLTYLDGVQLALPKLIESMKFQTPDDYKKMNLRLEAIPKQIQEIIDVMREGVLCNMTLHEISMNGVLMQLDQLQTNVETSPFLKPFLNIPLHFKLDQRAAIQDEARNILSNKIFPSFENLRNFLKFEYFQNLRLNVSIRSLTNGDNFYLKCLRFYVGFNATPQEIHNLGMEEVKRIRDEIERVIESLELKMPINEFEMKLRDDKDFCFRTADEVLEAYSGILFNEIRPKLHTVIHPLPELDLSILPAPTSITDDPPCHYFSRPSGYNPYVVYVNTSNISACTTYEMMASALHNAEPGHRLQLRYMMEMKDVPDFRYYVMNGKYCCSPSRFLSNVAFIEGWGMYSELLGYDLKVYEDPYFEYGHLCRELFRACGLVVDTGIHAFGWTREQAVNYMVKNTALFQDEIEREINRYITWPGYACAHKIGELKILQLRRKAAMTLGDKFDLRNFHDVILRSAGPLNFLEKSLDVYIHKELHRNS